MQRRKLVKNIAAGAAASLVANQAVSAQTAQTQGPQANDESLEPMISWRMPTSWPQRQGNYLSVSDGLLRSRQNNDQRSLHHHPLRSW